MKPLQVVAWALVAYGAAELVTDLLEETLDVVPEGLLVLGVGAVLVGVTRASTSG